MLLLPAGWQGNSLPHHKQGYIYEAGHTHNYVLTWIEDNGCDHLAVGVHSDSISSNYTSSCSRSSQGARHSYDCEFSFGYFLLCSQAAGVPGYLACSLLSRKSLLLLVLPIWLEAMPM